MKKAKIVGVYNEVKYTIIKIVKGEPNTVLYEAGNSPLDSQMQVSADKGVGLEKMKEYCEQTARELAEENYAEFAGVEYEKM